MRSISGLGVRTARRQLGRYLLTALGAALGVAVLFGVLITNASIDASLDRALGPAQLPGVLVQPVGSYGSTIPADVIDTAAALPEVVRAGGTVWVNVTAPAAGTGPDGEHEFMVRGGRSVDGPAVGRGFDFGDERFDFEGRLPAEGADEISLSRDLAARLGVGLDEPLELVTRNGPVTLRVVRLADVADDNGLVSLATAQRLLGRPDAVLDVWLELAAGTDPQGWATANAAAFGEGVRLNVRSGQGLREAVAVVQGGFGALGLMATFVGAFLIYLTLSTSVEERSRTWGVVRAVGGHRRAVVQAVLGEAMVLGVVATALGLLVGGGLAFLLLRFTGALYRLPSTSIEITPRTVITAAALGLLAPPLAAFVPARRAARAEPVDAIRGRHDGAARLGRLWIAGVVLLGLGALIARRPAGDAGIRVAPLVFMLGAVLVVPAVLKPVALIVGRVSARLVPGLGDAAVKHLVRERDRSAYTLGLLMAVLAMVIALTAVQGSILKAMHDAFSIRYGADVTVWAWNGMDPAVADALRGDGAVRASTVYRGGTVGVTSPTAEQGEISIIEPDSFFALQGFPWTEGDDDRVEAALTEGGAVIVPEAYALRSGLHLGDTITLTTTAGPQPFAVAGIYATPEPGLRIVTGMTDGERWFGASAPQGVELRAADDVSPESLLARATEIVGDRPGYFLNTTAGEERDAAERVQSNFRPFLAVILVAGVVGALGLANTLSMAILRRTREIGVLRAVGIDRRALGAMVVVESLTMGGVAFVLALPLGWVLASAVLRSTSSALGFVVDLAAPWSVLPFLAMGVVVLCVVAAAGPARSIARLDPIAALRFE